MNEKVKDPVCGKSLNKDDTYISLTIPDGEYHFCSEACFEKFEKTPRKYIHQKRDNKSV